VIKDHKHHRPIEVLGATPIIAPMRIRFTKMQGAGNDFVVLDETRGPLNLTPGQYRFLADRHFGVGADQVLSVRASPAQGIDFEYVIHNADGGQVEQCGNGARCFMRFVRDRGLTSRDSVKVRTLSRIIEPRLNPDGRVTVDMGAPVFEPAAIPFDAAGLSPQADAQWEKWHLALGARPDSAIISVAILSMGNPHVVLEVPDVDAAPVRVQGPLIEQHPRFPNRVNAGFMQVASRSRIRLRVWERGVGETLACGTGACAAVVAGIRLGRLDSRVDVETRGGMLTIEWAGPGPQEMAPVLMTGPAVAVFEGEIEVPD
jgi:diaminopimelate epimerase